MANVSFNIMMGLRKRALERVNQQKQLQQKRNGILKNGDDV